MSKRFTFKIPHSRGGKVFSAEAISAVDEAPLFIPPVSDINDMFLHVLFARIAASSGQVAEFGSRYNAEENSIEIDVPENILEFIESVEIKEKMARYIAWLTRNSQFWEEYTDANGDLALRPKPGFVNVEVPSITYSEVYQNGTNTLIDWSKGNKQSVSIIATTALTFLPPPGPTSLQLIINQDNIGHTVMFPSYLKWPNGNPTPNTATPEAIDVLSLLYDGQDYLTTMARNFS